MARKKVDELSESEALYDLLWKKFGTLDVSKIIHVQQLTDGTYSVKVGGKTISGTELQNLQNEATMIAGTQLWKLMIEAKKNAAHTYMFTGMKTLEDSHYGKTILYAISIDDLIFEALKKPHVNPVPKQYAKTAYPT